ncbi:MAG: radical SAM protein [Selenomonadaceae bacterium]|nr:radical SAM protein [Selenomonadaceae bacterium]
MYYKLAEPFAFRGFKRLPYAVRAERGEHVDDEPIFFDKPTFLELLHCDGEHDLCDLSDDVREVFDDLINAGVLIKSDNPLEPPKSYQRYKIFPCRYVDKVQWSITGKCNFRCRHCLVSAPDNRHPQPTLEQCLFTVSEFERCGIRKVDITGGEPFLRDDWVKIFDALAAAQIKIGIVFTNASLLDNHILDVLEKNNQHPTFQLSFDGLGHHDWLRGVTGAEQQAIDGFKLLHERNFRATAAMCLHKLNRHTLRDTANFLASLGVAVLMVSTPQELGIWKRYSQEYALSFDEAWEIYREYIPQWYADGSPLDIHLEGFFSARRENPRNYEIPFMQKISAGADWSKMQACGSIQHSIFIGRNHGRGRLACPRRTRLLLLQKYRRGSR